MPAEARLLAGTGRVDITSPPGTPQGGWGAQTHVRGIGADMPMLVTALALSQHDNRWLIIDADAIGFDQDWTSRIVAAIEKLTGIKQNNIRFSCSHTHSGPNTFRLQNITEGLDMAMAYLEDLPRRIAAAAWQALNSMVPVHTGVTTGSCVINRKRRVQGPGGETIVGVDEESSADPTVGVIRFDREDGSTLATIVHYACHPTTVGWQNEMFTPDYPGPMRTVVERYVGGRCLFLQGAAGDLGPRRGFTGELSVYRRLGEELGLTAAGLAFSIQTVPESARIVAVMPSGANIAQYAYEPVQRSERCSILARVLQLPIKALPPAAEIEKDLEQLRARVQALRESGDLEQMRFVQAKATQMGWRLENSRRYTGYATTDWQMQVMRIGDAALVSMAGEPFSSIAERIREGSRVEFTFVSGYSNGGFGYIPDRQAYSRGGYEVEATPFSEDAADIVVREALQMISELFKERT